MSAPRRFALQAARRLRSTEVENPIGGELNAVIHEKPGEGVNPHA